MLVILQISCSGQPYWESLLYRPRIGHLMRKRCRFALRAGVVLASVFPSMFIKQVALAAAEMELAGPVSDSLPHGDAINPCADEQAGRQVHWLCRCIMKGCTFGVRPSHIPRYVGALRLAVAVLSCNSISGIQRSQSKNWVSTVIGISLALQILQILQYERNVSVGSSDNFGVHDQVPGTRWFSQVPEVCFVRLREEAFLKGNILVMPCTSGQVRKLVCYSLRLVVETHPKCETGYFCGNIYGSCIVECRIRGLSKILDPGLMIGGVMPCVLTLKVANF